MRKELSGKPLLCVLSAVAVGGCAASGGRNRRPIDNVGYTHSAAGISKVVARAKRAERVKLAAARKRFGLTGRTAFVGAISPHDDYLYAMRVYVHVYPYIKARHVVMIGVAHKARRFPETEGRLVFDSYHRWHGPYGPVRMSPLRKDLLRRLSGRDAVTHNRLHSIEHSVEGMVPFLQHYNRKARIVSILVPYMSWERMRVLADRTSAALASAMKRRGLVLGRDVAVLISSDSVHYGDRGWGGKTFADFGVDRAGYEKAVARDLMLTKGHLEGEVRLEKLKGLYHRLVQKDYHRYRITWCGRFSVPFGVALLGRTASRLGRPPVKGFLLRYGTTLDPGRSGLAVPGLGVTAPANLRHWVGFAAVGYR